MGNVRETDFEIEYSELLDEDDEMIELDVYDFYQDMVDAQAEYIQNLEYESKNMYEFLGSLGYSDEQISDICLRGYRYSSCPEGSREGEKVIAGNVKF